MASRSAQLHAITTRTECSISDLFETGAIKTDKSGDLPRPFPGVEKMTHAAEIAFTLFANSADE